MPSEIPSGLVPGPCPVTVWSEIPAPVPGSLFGILGSSSWELKLEFRRPSSGALELLEVFIAPGGTFPRTSGASLTYDRVEQLFNERAAEIYPINTESRRFMLKYANPNGQINLRFVKKMLDVLPLPVGITTYFLDLLIVTGSGSSYKLDTLQVTANDFALRSKVTRGSETFLSSSGFIDSLTTSINNDPGVMLIPGLTAEHIDGPFVKLTLLPIAGAGTADVFFEAREVIEHEEGLILGSHLSQKIIAPRRVSKSINLAVGGTHNFEFPMSATGKVGFVAIVAGQHSNPVFLDVPG